MQTMEPAKHTTKSYYYDIFIRTTLGRYLPECLQEVTELKPADPIEYIAKWLYKVYDSQMYYKAKINYLREMYQLDEILKREKKEHEAKIKPFMQAMQAERWNYFLSLNAELDALDEYMADVDIEVDEGTKQRFLEVQLLIKEEEEFVKDPNMTSLPPAKTTSEKSVEAEPQVPMAPPKSNTSTPVSVRGSSIGTIVEERNSSVMEQMLPLTQTMSERLARSRLPAVRRLAQGSRRLSKQQRSSSAGLCPVRRAAAAAAVRKPYGDLTHDLDSDKRLWPVQSHDSQDGDLKQQKKPGDSSQVATTNFFRYVLDQSRSFVVDSLRSSPECCFDSDADQRGRSEVYERKQKTDAMSATKRRFDAAMRHSEGEDPDIHTYEIDGEISRGDSFSTSSQVSRCSTAERSNLSKATPYDKHSQETVVTSLPDDREEALSKKPHRKSLELLRLTTLSPSENDAMEYQGDVDEVSEEPDMTRSHRKDDCDRFHLPPVEIHGETKADGDGRFGERQDHHARPTSSEQVVHLPAIPPGRRTRGTLVMTNGGHIAFVSKELGVLASNSLKIRSVHPIDKPEMWALKNFQCQSFYDHELYSETDRLVVDSDEDDRWHRNIPKMTMGEFMEPPYRKWKRPEDERPG